MLKYYFIICYIIFTTISLRTFLLTSGYRPAINGGFNLGVKIISSISGICLAINPSIIFFTITLTINLIIWMCSLGLSTGIAIYAKNIVFDIEAWEQEYRKRENIEDGCLVIEKINKRNKYYRICKYDMNRAERVNIIKEMNDNYGISFKSIPKSKFTLFVGQLIFECSVFILFYNLAILST